MSEVLMRLPQRSHRDDEPEGVLASLVFALGHLAVEGVLEQPTSKHNIECSGFRGGTIDVPLGLDLFNKAQWRMGTINLHGRLENLQILLLQATYLQTNASHSDFWCAIRSTSTECIALIQIAPTE
jgi:hypothetical protein